VSEGGSTSKARGWGIVIGGVLIVAAVVALYSPSICLFDLRAVFVEGAVRLTPGDIVAAAGFRTGDNLLRLPLDAARERIRSLPWVAEARLSRRLPHTVRIDVVERVALAVYRTADAARWDVLASGGVVTEQVEDPPSDVLRLRGIPLASIEGLPAGALVEPGIVLLEALHAYGLGPPQFAELDVGDPNDIRLLSSESLVVHLGGLDEAATSARALAALLEQITADDYQAIDLTYDGEAFLVPR
jgi:cell division protein FtsQ